MDSSHDDELARRTEAAGLAPGSGELLTGFKTNQSFDVSFFRGVRGHETIALTSPSGTVFVLILCTVTAESVAAVAHVLIGDDPNDSGRWVQVTLRSDDGLVEVVPGWGS
jgi:hypothetical protein